MGSAGSSFEGINGAHMPCPQAEFCLQGLLARAKAVAACDESIEDHPTLMNGLDQSVIDSDETNKIYSLACQTPECDIKYAVGSTIEPQML